MPTYATRADCLDYTEGLTVDDDDAFDRLIERAERQVDALLLGVWGPRVNGLRVDPAAANPEHVEAVRRATCAQVEYRLEMGEEFFVRAQYAETAGPEFRTKGALPRVGPKVLEELRSAPSLTSYAGVAWY